MEFKDLQTSIDIEEVSKFEKLNREDLFIKKNFTEEEIDYCFSKSIPAIHLAGIFCVKEATIKTLEDPYINLKDIGVKHDKKGKPIITSTNKKLSNMSFKVSISHTGNFATAIVFKIDEK